MPDKQLGMSRSYVKVALSFLNSSTTEVLVLTYFIKLDCFNDATSTIIWWCFIGYNLSDIRFEWENSWKRSIIFLSNNFISSFVLPCVIGIARQCNCVLLYTECIEKNKSGWWGARSSYRLIQNGKSFQMTVQAKSFSADQTWWD